MEPMIDALTDDINRLCYLLEYCFIYRDIWEENSAPENWRRWYFARDRYLTAVDEVKTRYGVPWMYCDATEEDGTP